MRQRSPAVATAAASLMLIAGGVAPGQAVSGAVRATTIEGKVLDGELRGLDAEGRVVIVTADGEQALLLDQLRDVQHDVAVAALMPPVGLVVLWSGQTLRGNVRGVRGGGGPAALSIEVPPARTPVELAQRAIRALRFTDLPRTDGDAFDDALRERGAKDLLFAYRRGDAALGLQRISVNIRRFEAGEDAAGDGVRVVVDFDGKEQPAQPLRRLYGLVFGQGVAPDPRPGPRVTAHVAAGPTFTGALVALDPQADRCVLRLDEGCDIDLPWQHVANLAIRSDRLVYLSDLEPVAVEQTPAFTRKWPWLRDRAPLGPNLVLRGETFRRGLVLVPRTKLVFDLGGRYDRFEATAGIDDRAADLADAVIRVLGDDKVLFAAEHVKRGGLPHAVRVSVKDVQRLALEVDFGDNLDLSDHCVFADARVMRE